MNLGSDRVGSGYKKSLLTGPLDLTVPSFDKVKSQVTTLTTSYRVCVMIIGLFIERVSSQVIRDRLDLNSK